jgi:hypothetical protein
MREELARVVGCACDSLDHCTCGAAYLARRGRDVEMRQCCTSRTQAPEHLAANDARRRGAAWQDVLHEGPVPAVSRPQLLRLRAAFLSECGWGSRRAILSSLERRDRRLEEALREGVQVVLWFEHDLFDQLQLGLDVLAFRTRAWGRAGADRDRLVFPGKPAFRGSAS